MFSSRIINFFHDDSFFYIKTAYNNSIGVFSSFDTVNKTSGYHPLYMLLLTAISLIIPLIGAQGVATVFFLDMVLFLFFLLFVDRIMDHFQIDRFLKTPITLILICTLAFNDFGIEVRLLLPLFWMLIYLLIKKYRGYLFLGLISSLIFLTRLDSVIFIFFISLFLFLENKNEEINKKRLYQMVLFLVPLTIVFSLYFSFNIFYFKHISSISSWLKFGFFGVCYPIIHGSFGVKVRFVVCLVSSLLFLFYFIKQILNKIKNSEEFIFTVLNLSSIVFLLVISSFSRGGLASWYFSLPMSICIVTAGYLMNIFYNLKIKSLTWIKSTKILIIACVVLFLLILLNRKLNYHYQDDAIAISHWIENNIDKNINIYQVDNSGFTGYVSNRNVINGDGLINSWEYQNYLRSGDLIGYFKKYSINYVIWDKYNDEKQIIIPVMLWSAPDEHIIFDKLIIVKQLGRFVLLKIDNSKIILIK